MSFCFVYGFPCGAKALLGPICVCVYIYTLRHKVGILLSHEKEWNKAFAETWMDLEVIILSEVKWVREKQICDIAYMWNLKKKKKMNLYTKEK